MDIGLEPDADSDVGEEVEPYVVRPESIRLAVGNELRMRVAQGEQLVDVSALNFASTDREVAKVSGEGVVTARRTGPFTIIVSDGQQEVRIDGEVTSQSWTQIDVSRSLTCALDTDGRIYCAGAVDHHMSATGVSYPQHVSKLRPLPRTRRFTSFAVMQMTVCAIDVVGDVYCRGRNYDGAADPDSPEFSTDFRLVPELSELDMTELVAGESHFCARNDHNRVWCWGDNTLRQLGRIYVDGVGPVEVELDEPAVDLAAGDWHTCARDASGRAHCWGGNLAGQLGLEHSRGPMEPRPTLFADTFEQLAAGRFHTCGLSEGTVYCWGSNKQGELGSGPVPNVGWGISYTPRPAMVDDATYVEAVFLQTCALDQWSRAHCWGDNGQGVLGGEEPKDFQMPTVIAGHRFTHLSLGPSHACGVSVGGELLCWGTDYHATTASGREMDYLVPQLVDERGGSLAVGTRHTCRQRGDELECWGSNRLSQYGDGTEVARSRPEVVSSGWQDVAAGDTFTCGVRDEKIYCWGLGTDGRFRLSRGERFSSTPKVAFTGLRTDSIRITGGRGVALGEGLFYTWGEDHIFDEVEGYVKQSDGTREYIPFESVTIGAMHGCGLVADLGGEAYCWGNLPYVGGFSTSLSSQYVRFGVPVETEQRFSQLAAGYTHTCGITLDGHLYCWGELFEVGEQLDTPLLIATEPSFESIYGGGHFGCGLDASGAAYCWGRNTNGELGDGTRVTRRFPVPVAGDLRFKELGLGAHHVCGVTTDDKTYCWGANASFEVGLGARTIEMEPRAALVDDAPLDL